MSVVIKGMDIPQSCYMCDMIELSGAISCPHANNPRNSERGRALDCPLIEIPDHGDLIDRDALMARYAEEVSPSNHSDFMRPPRWNDAVQLTELAPVVIPAERSEE